MGKRNRGRNRRGKNKPDVPPTAGGGDSAGPSNVTTGNTSLHQSEWRNRPSSQPVRQTPPIRRNNENTTGNGYIPPHLRSTEWYGGGRYAAGASDRLPSRTVRPQNGPSLPGQPHATPQTTVNSENLESQSSSRSTRPPPGSSTWGRDRSFGTGSREVYGDENQPWPTFLPRSGREPRTAPQANGSSQPPTPHPRRNQNTNATPSSLEGYRDARLVLDARFRALREEQSLQNPRSRVTLAQLGSTPRAIVSESASTEPPVSQLRSIRQAQEQPQRTPIVIRDPDSHRPSRSAQPPPDPGGPSGAGRSTVERRVLSTTLPEMSPDGALESIRRELATRQVRQNTAVRTGPSALQWGPVATTRDTDQNRTVSTGPSVVEWGPRAATNNVEQNPAVGRGHSVLERRLRSAVPPTTSSRDTTTHTQPQAAASNPSLTSRLNLSESISGTRLGRNNPDRTPAVAGVGVQSTSHTMTPGAALFPLPRRPTDGGTGDTSTLSTPGNTTAVPSRSQNSGITSVPEVRRRPENNRPAIVMHNATSNDEDDLGSGISFGAQLPHISSSRRTTSIRRITPAERSNNGESSLWGHSGGELAEPEPEPPLQNAGPSIANQALAAATIGIIAPGVLIGSAVSGVLAGVRSAGSLFTIFGRAPPPAEQTPPIPEPVASAPTPEPLDLRQLAEDVSVLLELYSRTEPGENGEGHRRLIESANESFSKIRTHHGVGESPTPNPDMSSTTVDAACIVCYDRIADTVLVPCNHLVLCGTCCDTMGVKGRDDRWRVAVPCPMCRRIVTDRIKIYRG